MIQTGTSRNPVDGTITDVAVSTDSDGTISAKLRGLVKLMSESGESYNFASWGEADGPEQFSVRERYPVLAGW